jgi:8-oxo-dGTP pyrophosphatase MutT (NUDIX family)
MSIDEPHREVAAAILVGTCGRLLFQQRDDIPGLRYAGMVGLFGGHHEGSESRVETVLRELEEEIGIAFTADRLEPLVTLSARYPASGGMDGSFFVIRDVPLDRVAVTEGSALIIAPAELPTLLARMTPSACYVARLFMESERTRR